jgi:hypothetical protein
MHSAFGLLFRLGLALTIWIVGIPLSIHLNLDNIAVRTLHATAWGFLTVAVVVPHFFWGGVKNLWRSAFPLPQEELLVRAREAQTEALRLTEVAKLLEKEATSMEATSDSA